VHAAAGLRAPIVGDVLYGGEPAVRLMLHASELSFREPRTGRRVSFESRAPF
jgi:tRNA pseudouridine32 synthase/23S rRNA pseudouridine746 synthase